MARILVVDDSPTELLQFSEVLSRQGHHVLTAPSGDAALELASVAQPDVILMDVVMPGMDGFQATRRLTRGEATRHIPVIIVSAKRQETDAVWGQRQGAACYLTKPVTDRKLIAAVNDVLA
jgi:twitching motility two-component system response regulator PilH